MLAYKQEFIDFMVRSGVLTFGDFLTKSGRRTPFFINTGRYGTGTELMRLGRFYAQTIVERLGTDFDVLFGPAYKGIPLVVCTAIALAEEHGKDVGFCFNRKEAKDHGEGGLLVGKQLTDGARVVIVEDVTTAGTSIRETLPILQQAANIHLRALVVAVDRMERGSGERSALAEIRNRLNIPAFSIVTIDEIIESLTGRELDGRLVLDAPTIERLAAYRQEYGAKGG
jgi:orotate phosphoribosyltransferase